MTDAILNSGQGDSAASGDATGERGTVDPTAILSQDRDTYPTMLIQDALRESREAAEAKAGVDGGKDKDTETSSIEGEPGKDKETKPAESFDIESHPKYREMVDQLSEMRGMIGTLKDMVSQGGARGTGGEYDEKPDFINVMELPEDKFREMQDEDPRSLFANMGRQILHEVREALQGELSTQSTTEKRSNAYKDFVEKNKDFLNLYRAGALQPLLDNPIHNHVSAYLELTGPKKLEKALKEQTETHKKELAEAVKKAREDERNSILARSGARVLGSGPAISPASREGVSPELKNSKSHGGMTRVLLKRHEAREAARTG